MVNFFKTRSYWQGGFTEDQREYYKEYRLSQKGIHLWKIINTLNNYGNVHHFHSPNEMTPLSISKNAHDWETSIIS